MEILKAYKYRIYPDKEQSSCLAQCFGAKRWIFNHFLNDNKTRYLNKEQYLNAYDINYEITKLKKETDTIWLRQVDDWCLKNAGEDLHNAYQQFFNSITGKRKGPKVSSPKFKSKYDKQSYRTRGVKIDFETNKIKLPKIKKQIKCVVSRPFVGKIKQSTISKSASGHYYISILVEENISLKPATGKEIGIDLGIKDLAILSNGVKFTSPKELLSKATRELKKQQLKLSRKTKGSKNYQVQKIKVAKKYQRISNQRNSYYHQISSYLVSNFDAIYMENLNVKGMMQNRKLSRAISESSWGVLENMISYKAGWYGKTFHQIGRFVPSSKTCSCCGHKLEKLDLGTRSWTCPTCFAEHDRDLNAATNIKQFGQLDVYGQVLKNSSDAIAEVVEIPMALQKMTSKIERSGVVIPVSHGSGQTAWSLAAQ